MQTGKIVPEQNKWPCVVDQIQSVRHAAFVNQSKQRNVIKVPLSCFNWKEQNNNGRINLVSEVSFLLPLLIKQKKSCRWQNRLGRGFKNNCKLRKRSEIE